MLLAALEFGFTLMQVLTVLSRNFTDAFVCESGLGWKQGTKDEIDGRGITVSVDAALFSFEEAKDKLGDDLLGELTGAIDIVAAGDDDREVVGPHVCLFHGNFVRHKSGGIIHVETQHPNLSLSKHCLSGSRLRVCTSPSFPPSLLSSDFHLGYFERCKASRQDQQRP